MARYFEITVNTPTVKLDSQGRGTVQYKLKNLTPAAIDGRAVLVSLPTTTPPSGVVQKNWVKIDGPTDRHFEKDVQEVFTVKIEVPLKDRPKTETTPGTYTFRLDGVTVAVPDRGDEGPAVAFTLAAAAAKKPINKLVWIIPLIVVLLLAIGGGVWLALRSSGGKVPDLTGMSMTDATNAITAAKLTLDKNVETVQSKPADADKVVSQTPAAGADAKPGDAVSLKMGAEMVSVPNVVGHTYKDAQNMLTAAHLTPGKATSQSNPNFAGSGIVVSTSPDAGSQQLSGATVNLSVTPQTVSVPALIGLSVGDAIGRLQSAGLQFGTLSGDQKATPVTNQSVAANTQAPVGTTVNLTVASSAACSPPSRCIYNANTVRMMTLQKR
jgi:beta-lactam-binding protein with PASTA domain